MENHKGSSNRDGSKSNGQRTNLNPALVTLPWLDLRVFYVRVSQCVIDESTPEFLTLNHMPLNRDTLLEVNGVRAGTYPNPVSALLRRDRLDRRSEEATFVSTDVIRMTGSTKFEVVVEDVVVLSGVIELCRSNGSVRDAEGHGHGHGWSMRCESDLVPGNGFMKLSRSLGSPSIDVYVTGTFQGNPIILTNTFHLSSPRNQTTNSFTQDHNSDESYHNRLHDQIPQMTEDLEHKDENEEHYNNNDENNNNMRMQQYQEYPEGELSWFNAGVRVGVGIGLSVCLGIGIGVGLLVRTYQGTARNFRRQLF